MPRVDGGTRLFWTLIAMLLSASLYFGLNADSRRHDAELASGELVRLARIVEPDSVIVEKASGRTVRVRLLGVKPFGPRSPSDASASFGKAAIDKVSELAKGDPIRVFVHTNAKDEQGRTVATLFAKEHDLGLVLIENGLALAYGVEPFATLALYLREQQSARAERRGLWADPELAARADELVRTWRREAP